MTDDRLAPARGCVFGLVIMFFCYGVGFFGWRLVQWVAR